MTSKSWADTQCGVFCQVAKCALGENGRADDPRDDVGWQHSRVVMWPSGQALHAYALYWAIGFSSNVLYLLITMDVCRITGCRFGPVSGPILRWQGLFILARLLGVHTRETSNFPAGAAGFTMAIVRQFPPISMNSPLQTTIVIKIIIV